MGKTNRNPHLHERKKNSQKKLLPNRSMLVQGFQTYPNPSAYFASTISSQPQWLSSGAVPE